MKREPKRDRGGRGGSPAWLTPIVALAAAVVNLVGALLRLL